MNKINKKTEFKGISINNIFDITIKEFSGVFGRENMAVKLLDMVTDQLPYSMDAYIEYKGNNAYIWAYTDGLKDETETIAKAWPVYEELYRKDI